ncbi:sulfite exporter TauE/SafE family protein [Thermanaerothrix sp. 4228-RoL]|uniref:Probable membrane transporter protein n=1 Tax=Thermanaerothrix solaris TaxID=3058434 RepID=A0ABU3NP17_9CHLR|nr:sulfite exporter TauE/SafE family protein [Thermanaerothrix sp. 4228-RoL]MDT8898582.1 sulfite exporter TauE/SafE family protein [Thermanaerothrix sp. 4228-RoL]
MPAGENWGQRVAWRRATLAFLSAIPIGWVGALIGLGGAEFRLPVLVGALGFPSRRAVPLNLAVSFLTLGIAFFVRGRVLPWAHLIPLWPMLGTLLLGSLSMAFWGAGWLPRVRQRHLERAILILLAALGLLLITEAFLPLAPPGGGLPTGVIRYGIAFLAGLGIGLVSSLLGVAGGELIIPTLVILFGVEVKLAGSASVLIGLPTVAIGLARHLRRGLISSQEGLQVILPMGLGTFLGAGLAGPVLGRIAPAALKVLLGLILLFSAWRVFHPHQVQTATSGEV